MNKNDILQKPLGEVTLSELLFLFHGSQNNEPMPIPDLEEKPTESLDKFEYGIDGIARILGCGKTKAQEIKKSGILDQAVIHAGRKIKIHKEKALELYQKNQHKI